MSLKGAALHSKRTGAFFGISAHGLVDHDGLGVFFLYRRRTHGPHLIHGAFEVAVRQFNAVFPSMTAPSEWAADSLAPETAMSAVE